MATGHGQTDAQRQLLEFLLLLRAICLAFTALELALAFVGPRGQMVLIAAVTGSMALASLGVARLVHRGMLDRAVTVTAWAIFGAISLVSPFAPAGIEALVMVPAIGVALTLPHLRGRRLGEVVLGGFLCTLWIAATSGGLSGTLRLSRPTEDALEMTATLVVTSLLMLLLWQASQTQRRALDAAEAAVRTREEFLTVASHELRTPLSSLQLTMQALQAGATPPAPREHLMGLAERQVRRLTRLVNEMLTVGKIQSGRLDVEVELERVDLGELVREVSNRFALEAARAGCEIRLQLGTAEGEWDRLKLDHVISNLVSNALKFGAGHPVDISVATSPGQARVIVADRGIGIAAEALPRLFQKFERAVSTRNYGGLGLGLFITRTLTEGLGGRIYAESEGPGAGARFIVELPLA